MLQVLVGFFIILLIFIFDRKNLDVKTDKITKFLTFMALVTAFRLALNSFQGNLPQGGLGIPFYMFAIVPWEDAFYVAPLLYLDYMRETKWGRYMWNTLAIALSIHFGLGHAYQGLFGIAITSLYPYFVSYKYSKRTSLGTVMVCHILYDMITVLTMKYSWMTDF
jgi:hypothetical protein